MDRYVTLNPVPTTEPTTQSPLPAPVIVASVLGAVLVRASRRNLEAGGK